MESNAASQPKKCKIDIDRADSPHIGDNIYNIQLSPRSPDADIPASSVQEYLTAIATAYHKWWERYILTDAEGKQRQSKNPSPIFDFGLMVQTEKKEDREQQEAKVERLPVLEGIRKYVDQHVLLVGRPGSGKSTTLVRLLFEEATTTQARIPVLIELRYWQGSIEQLILNSFARYGLPLTVNQLEMVLSRSLILFDGVNELPSEEARSQLSVFRRNHLRLSMIFTTRDLSLGGDLGIEQQLEMHPLTETQMQEFIRAYVPEQAEVMLRQLRDRLREFGKTPLLLYMLCEVFQQSPNNQLPSNLAGVFEAFTAMYEISSVRKHEVALLKGDVKPLSDRRLWKKALKALAAAMMQGKTPIDFRVVIDREEAEQELSKVFPTEQFPIRDILDDLLKFHLLQNHSADQIEFRHQLIQEYYAAEHLRQLLPNLTDEQLQRDYLNYLKWTESIALMLALEKREIQALRVVELALDLDLILGARLAGEVEPSFQEQTTRLILGETTKGVSQFFQVILLSETRSRFSVPSLSQSLKCKDYFIRMYSAYGLGKIGSKDAIETLIQVLKEDDDHLSRSAATALGMVDSEIVVPYLKEALSSNTIYTSLNAATSLAKLSPQTAKIALIESLTHSNEIVRLSASSAIKDLISKEAEPTKLIFNLIELAFKESSPSVRRNAVPVLRYLEPNLALPYLKKFLQDSDSIVRNEAAHILEEIASSTQMTLLIELADNKHSSIRTSAISALGKIADKSALPILEKALGDLRTEVCEKAAFALGKICSQESVPSLAKALKSHNLALRRSAACALSKINNKLAQSHLQDVIDDEDPLVRWTAIEALQKTQSKAFIHDIMRVLNHNSDKFTRMKAVSMLPSCSDDETTVTTLADILEREDEDSVVRCSAAKILGGIGSKDAKKTLLKAFHNALCGNDLGYFMSLIQALENIGSSDLIIEFQKIYWHSEARIRFYMESHLRTAIISVQKRCGFYSMKFGSKPRKM